MVISLDVEQARSTASTFSNCAEQIDGELSTLNSSVNSVLTTWQGMSRAQFEEQWESCTASIRQLSDRLRELSRGLTIEANEFESADSRFNG